MQSKYVVKWSKMKYVVKLLRDRYDKILRPFFILQKFDQKKPGKNWPGRSQDPSYFWSNFWRMKKGRRILSYISGTVAEWSDLRHSACLVGGSNPVPSMFTGGGVKHLGFESERIPSKISLTLESWLRYGRIQILVEFTVRGFPSVSDQRISYLGEYCAIDTIRSSGPSSFFRSLIKK
jgi:hypothetical protein